MANPPPPNDQIPPPKDSGGAIVGRAMLGFLAYCFVGWLSLASQLRSSVPVVLFVIFALGLAVAGKWRGFALGVFIGVGLTLLLVGICLATFKV